MARKRRFRIAVRKYGPFENAMHQQWQDFERVAQTGLELDLVPLDLRPLEHALFDSGGMVNGDWDISFVATDWIAAMHSLGCAVDLKPLLHRDPPPDYPHGWSESLLRLQRIDDQILGIPFHDGPECLIYRRDLFDDPVLRRLFYQRFHYPLAPPSSWAGFHRIATFLQAPEKNLYGTVFAAFPDGHNAVYDFLLQLWTRSGELISERGNIRFQTPQAKDALSFYRAMLNDSSAVYPLCRQLDSVAAGERFTSGEVAMMVNWFGFAAYAHTAEDSAVRGLVDVTHLPVGAGGKSVSLNVYWILSLASGSTHREIAWHFMRHTQTPAMDKLTTDAGAIGCRRSTWTNPAINARIPFFTQLETLHQHAREIPQRKDWPYIAEVIDKLMLATINTEEPIDDLLALADRAIKTMR
jgi:multiple sugar transport system substrate-binding protein